MTDCVGCMQDHLHELWVVYVEPILSTDEVNSVGADLLQLGTNLLFGVMMRSVNKNDSNAGRVITESTMWDFFVEVLCQKSFTQRCTVAGFECLRRSFVAVIDRSRSNDGLEASNNADFETLFDCGFQSIWDVTLAHPNKDCRSRGLRCLLELSSTPSFRVKCIQKGIDILEACASQIISVASSDNIPANYIAVRVTDIINRFFDGDATTEWHVQDVAKPFASLFLSRHGDRDTRNEHAKGLAEAVLSLGHVCGDDILLLCVCFKLICLAKEALNIDTEVGLINIVNLCFRQLTSKRDVELTDGWVRLFNLMTEFVLNVLSRHISGATTLHEDLLQAVNGVGVSCANILLIHRDEETNFTQQQKNRLSSGDQPQLPNSWLVRCTAGSFVLKCANVDRSSSFDEDTLQVVDPLTWMIDDTTLHRLQGICPSAMRSQIAPTHSSDCALAPGAGVAMRDYLTVLLALTSDDTVDACQSWVSEIQNTCVRSVYTLLPYHQFGLAGVAHNEIFEEFSTPKAVDASRGLQPCKLAAVCGWIVNAPYSLRHNLQNPNSIPRRAEAVNCYSALSGALTCISFLCSKAAFSLSAADDVMNAAHGNSSSPADGSFVKFLFQVLCGGPVDNIQRLLAPSTESSDSSALPPPGAQKHRLPRFTCLDNVATALYTAVNAMVPPVHATCNDKASTFEFTCVFTLLC